jgi:hypothetical protein
MPVKRCSKNGQSGWKWGASGVCYTGPDGKEKARQQGLAVLRTRARKAGVDPDEYIKQHSDEL